MRIAAAASLYFAIVFDAGFLLGAIRVCWLEPRVGPTVAVLCEAPFILTFTMAAAHWVLRVVKLRRSPAALMLRKPPKNLVCLWFGQCSSLVRNSRA
jgi:hypothetical protein